MLAVYSDASIGYGLRKPVCLAFVVVEDGKIKHRHKRTFFANLTTSDAEYDALIAAMRWVLKNTQPQKVSFFTDLASVIPSVYSDSPAAQHRAWTVRALLQELQQNGFDAHIYWTEREFNIAHEHAYRGLRKLVEIF